MRNIVVGDYELTDAKIIKRGLVNMNKKNQNFTTTFHHNFLSSSVYRQSKPSPLTEFVEWMNDAINNEFTY